MLSCWAALRVFQIPIYLFQEKQMSISLTKVYHCSNNCLQCHDRIFLQGTAPVIHACISISMIQKQQLAV